MEYDEKQLWFFIGLLIVVGLTYIVPDIVAELAKEDAPLLAIIVTLARGVIFLEVQMGLIKITLKFCDNGKGEFADLFSCFPLFFKYLVGTILYGLIILGGTILLIVPGIIWGIKFQFFSYFIVDKRLGPIEALKRSSAITKGAKWDLFLFDLLLLFINLAGVIFLYIGSFATIPTTMVAMAFVYRKLEAEADIAQLAEASTERMNR